MRIGKKESEFCFHVSVRKVEKRRDFGRKWREAKNKGGEPIFCRVFLFFLIQVRVRLTFN